MLIIAIIEPKINFTNKNLISVIKVETSNGNEIKTEVNSKITYIIEDNYLISFKMKFLKEYYKENIN